MHDQVWATVAESTLRAIVECQREIGQRSGDGAIAPDRGCHAVRAGRVYVGVEERA